MNETTSGAPLTATVGERLSGDPHVEEARKAVAGRRAGGDARSRRPFRPFPWGTLALLVIGWAFATAIGRRARSRATREGRRLREAAEELRHGVRSLARR